MRQLLEGPVSRRAAMFQGGYEDMGPFVHNRTEKVKDWTFRFKCVEGFSNSR